MGSQIINLCLNYTLCIHKELIEDLLLDRLVAGPIALEKELADLGWNIFHGVARPYLKQHVDE